MKTLLLVICLALFSGVCCADSTEVCVSEPQIIQYQVHPNQYAVVVPIDGVNAAEAKQMALRRAAEITVQAGGRYFTINKEEETQVVKSGDPWPNENAYYGNMYQELIVEGNFGKNQTQAQFQDSGQIYPARRLLFTIYSTKPWGKSVDACTLTDCK